MVAIDMQQEPQLPPYPANPEQTPDDPPIRGPGQEPELPSGEPPGFPVPDLPNEMPPVDPPGNPGMPPATAQSNL
jgi:hypothetical protein